MSEPIYGDDHEPEKKVEHNPASGMWNVTVNGAHVGSMWSQEEGEILANWWIEQVYSKKERSDV